MPGLSLLQRFTSTALPPSWCVLVKLGVLGLWGATEWPWKVRWCGRAGQQLQRCSSSLWEDCPCRALSLCFDLPGARGYWSASPRKEALGLVVFRPSKLILLQYRAREADLVRCAYAVLVLLCFYFIHTCRHLHRFHPLESQISASSHPVGEVREDPTCDL